MLRSFSNIRATLSFVAGLLIVLAPAVLRGQSLNLEGQTGGYVIPAAYTIPSDAGHKWSAPTLGFHYLKAGTTIGDFYISSVAEGYGNWLEFGYSRNSHSNGNDFNVPPYNKTGASALWAYSGFNVFSGKVKILAENRHKKNWIPAVSVGGIFRQGDYFVTGVLPNPNGNPLNHQAHNNGDFYIVATKLVRETKIPLLLDFGVRGTNAQLYGAGGQAGSAPVAGTATVGGAPTFTNSNAWVAKPFGGLGIPIPFSKKSNAIVVEPGAEIAPQPHYTQNLPTITNSTVEVYGFRFTQLPTFRWTLDAGVGHIGNQLGPGFYIHANTVESIALTYRFK
jgi:hypothetical protein